MDKKAILVVSFGTSYRENCDKTIGAVEDSFKEAFPDFTIRRAFTSRMIIQKLKERDGTETDDVESAVRKLSDEGYGTLIIQPTHVMGGIENDRMTAAVQPYSHCFRRFAIGRPVLGSGEDFKRVMELLAEQTREYDREDTAVVFMGHGSDHEANADYAALDESFKQAGHPNYVVGTVEAELSLGGVIKAVQEMHVRKVALLPFMIVAGDHANRDMAGEEKGSWRREFEAAGYETECVMKGLGEYREIRELLLDHARAAIRQAKNGRADHCRADIK